MKKLISISLTILLLIGNIGFTFGTHICGGHAVLSEFMIGEKHLDCGMAMMEMPEPSNENQQLSKPPCCDNEYVSMEVGELFKPDISIEYAPVAVAITMAKLVYIISTENHVDQSFYFDTSPHLARQDFQVLHQVFRI